MKSAIGYAVVAALIALGLLAYRGDLGNLIGGDTGKAVQETKDKAQTVTKEKAVESAAVVKDELSKAKDATAKKVKEVQQAARGESEGDKARLGKSVLDPMQPGSTTAEKSPEKAKVETEKTGIIEKAVNVIKKAVSVTEPSPIEWPVVSEEDWEKQRQARLSTAAKSPKPAVQNDSQEAASASASDTKVADATSGEARGDGENAATPQSEAKMSGGDSSSAPAQAKMTPYNRVKSVSEGSLKNPFDYKDQKIVAEGQKTYLKFSCNGCHGGGGGGGMCPPLTNETWVYGGDDDTLFRLITLGSDELGRARKGQETVVGPMPPYKDIIKDEDQLWKIIVYIRSKWGGREKKIEW